MQSCTLITENKMLNMKNKPDKHITKVLEELKKQAGYDVNALLRTNVEKFITKGKKEHEKTNG